MGRKRFYDAARDLTRDVHDPPEQPRSRRRLSISSLLIAPQTCVACWDPVPLEGSVFLCNTCCAPLCPPCLTQYARSAISDRQLLPLRCPDIHCRAPLPLSALNHLLTAAEISKLSRFQCELVRKPPATDLPSISQLPTTPQPDSDTTFLALMYSNGWRRCPECGIGIERTFGCPHMVCVCGGEFCYSCGEPWGKCGLTCPRRHAVPTDHDPLLALLPARFEELRDEVWERMVALLHRLRHHLENDFPLRLPNSYPNHASDWPTLMPQLVSQGFTCTSTNTAARTRLSESRPVKMRLRSLVHPE
ncbi:hypothetical protein BWQ96_05735 [Gracilariopsis chorda]|uniref:RBR-type E3 ubiquitin transferase n=1 Tax=Gracilariopsis chorda TaxID=448386 RepID=A0A2V3IS38_9FLOR|nr:hypothetical protein BWQ96_05735 [Gracilariopsis chorda]|eukprot:PXF44557.1 hypothetical protein BWQ96_05735 [Gracilariopsis chorda]